MALDLPKAWPSCPGCSQSVTGANVMKGSSKWTAHPCGCPIEWPLVAKVIRVSGASA